MGKRFAPFISTLCDAYKQSHHKQYPAGTRMVYSNFTPRKSRVPGVDKFVFFGLQAAMLKIHEAFEEFFEMDREDAISQVADHYKKFFGTEDDLFVARWGQLYDLGYLPVSVSALPEGSIVDHRVPVFTIFNTVDDCFWVTNWLETWLSNEIWLACTSATTASYFRHNFDEYADLTSDNPSAVMFQGHDFSFRGMSGLDAAMISGSGHLLSFLGTDTIPAVEYIEYYYGGDNGLIGTSIPATEHSVVCAGGEENERETLKRMLTEVYPSGFFSYVSDSYDFWKVVTEILPSLKQEILNRDGKLVIRPDSSPKTPVEIICGDPDAPEGTPENKGLFECLWEIFGGTINSKGYRVLDPHIGAIYGDSITLEYQQQILWRLYQRKFDTTQIVLGMGSYTYQYVTRDTHGCAIKATLIEDKDGNLIPIHKDPKTDDGTKRSARGLLLVYENDNGDYKLRDNMPLDPVEASKVVDALGDAFNPVYYNGNYRLDSFKQVRAHLDTQRWKLG